VLRLQRTVGNQVVASLLGGPGPAARPSGPAPIVQREPMVWQPDQNKRVDAADWTDEELTKWQTWYFKETPENQKTFLKDNNAVLQMIAKRGKAEAKFQESKQAMTRLPGRDEIDRARELLMGLLAEEPTGWVFNDIDPIKAVKELNAAIQEPGAMDQAGFPICGADTYLRIYAIHHPLEYVRFAIDILKTGTGRLGKQTVTAPHEIRARKKFEDEVHISEWIMTASLRSQSNLFFGSITATSDFAVGGKWLAGLSGMTTVPEMKGWFQAAGVPAKAMKSEDFTFSLFGGSDKDTIAEINRLFQQGRAVALAIHGDIVNNPIDHEIPADPGGGHFVTLASTFVLTGKNYIADAYTWGGAKKMRFTSGQISRAIHGYVAVDMRQFAPHNAEQKAVG
jgi:hypothetical protein